MTTADSAGTSSTTVRQPAIYLPHGGGPWPFMDDGGRHRELARWLQLLPSTLPQAPAAILVVTAHWEAERFTIAGGERPSLIYDYDGFPAETYQVTYPAPGHPAVAERVAALATAAGIDTAIDESHGWDHGVFVPISVAWPAADTPVVAVSLLRGLDPLAHLDLGRALTPLRDENVVIIGSGLSTHDLSFRVRPAEAEAFDRWLEETMGLDPQSRAARLATWSSAPGGRASHPREEHLLPAMVVAGAGDHDPVERSWSSELFGLPAAGYRFG